MSLLTQTCTQHSHSQKATATFQTAAMIKKQEDVIQQDKLN